MSLLKRSNYIQPATLINNDEYLSPMAERIMGLATECRTRIGNEIPWGKFNSFTDDLHPKDQEAVEPAMQELVAKGYLEEGWRLKKYR